MRSVQADGNGSDDYDSATQHLDAFGISLRSLIRHLLEDACLGIHSVEFRVKGRESASRKLGMGGDRYGSYDDLTDMLGIRVITYFPDEVDLVAKVLIPEFEVDEKNSVDKRKALDPDRFGYLSLHYIASLGSNRTQLPEYTRFEATPFEIQIRSILQHAWAEIEHDLGYKAEGALPREMRRRFSRLAGLLELADDEFTRLREDRDSYEKQVASQISNEQSSLSIDQSTVSALIQTESILSLDQQIAAHFPAELDNEIDTHYAARLARDLQSLGVGDVATLSRLVSSRSSYAVAFAKVWLDRRDRTQRSKPLSRGISVFYLVYTLVAGYAGQPVIEHWNEGRPKPASSEMMSQIEETWRKVVEELGTPNDADSELGDTGIRSYS